MKRASRKSKRDVRHVRVRRKLTGTPDRPRLVVFKSSKHMYAQIIDDLKAHTLLSASSLTPKVKEMLGQEKSNKTDSAKIIGKYIGELSVSMGIKEVCFDRGGYPYHGRIKAFADGAREAGLVF
ncbi:MAG TPA: 50S ribosomal protein L18 [Thermodesulfobacteriota bacterium]|nr:50S ribosomal protein L18 [Thermodesulfobacteriota bacterium]